MLRPEEAEGVLRAAFADADIFLNVSVPPRLPHSAQHPRFAAARCGVIWHRCAALLNVPERPGPVM